MVRPGVMPSESGTSYMVSRAGQMVRPPVNGGSVITDPATERRVMVSQGHNAPGPPARMMSGPRTSAEDMVLMTGGTEPGGMALPGQAGSCQMVALQRKAGGHPLSLMLNVSNGPAETADDFRSRWCQSPTEETGADAAGTPAMTSSHTWHN